MSIKGYSVTGGSYIPGFQPTLTVNTAFASVQFPVVNNREMTNYLGVIAELTEQGYIRESYVIGNTLVSIFTLHKFEYTPDQQAIIDERTQIIEEAAEAQMRSFAEQRESLADYHRERIMSGDYNQD